MSANATVDSLTLQVLLAGTAGGDREAFERLYRLVSPKLFGICFAILRHEPTAEESLQEVFVQIWRDAASFDPTRGQPFTWMAGIARHRSLDALRRRSHDRAHPGFAGEIGNLGEIGDRGDPARAEGASTDDASASDPLLALVLHQNASALHHCLHELTDDQRQCITLAFFHDLSHGELSRWLDTPIGTVKSWVRRGLLALKRCLES